MKIILPLLFGLLGASSATAQTATVTMTDDFVDFGGAQQLADLPGPDGLVSFREACTAANNTPGPQTIAFAIPNTASNEWSGGVAILFMDFDSFFLSDDQTTVDFSTQTVFTGNTNPLGNEVGIRTTPPAAGAAAIYIGGDSCVIIGLDRVILHGYGIRIGGNNNRVIGCNIWGANFAAVYITGLFGGAPATGNIIGGTNPGEGNILSSGNAGVRIDGPARDNVVIGNTLSGNGFAVEVRTPTCCPNNDAINNRIGGPTVAERNVIRGAGEYSSEGFPTGGMVNVEYSFNTIVEGNYIGVNANGVTIPALQLGPTGIQVRESPGTIVRDNLISGIAVTGINHAAGQRFGTGIHLYGECGGSIIQSNLLGSDAGGLLPLPNFQGIFVDRWPGSSFAPLLVGGTLPGEGNTLAFMETSGLQVHPGMESATLRGNLLHDNGTLGIDLLVGLGAPGQTANDVGDLDGGANGLQNYPVLQQVTLQVSSTTVMGTLDSLALSSFDLDFFASSNCDASGFGESETYLGSVTVTTDVNGLAVFNAVLPSVTPSGWFVTATATQLSTGNTSELAACLSDTPGVSLSVSPLIRAQTATLTADGAIAAETVTFAYSLVGTGPGPCPGALGGLCLDILSPVTIAGNGIANGSGVAALIIQVPAQAPLIDVHMQAVILRGLGGINSVKSNTVTATIQ